MVLSQSLGYLWPHSPDNTRLRFSIRNKARFQFTWYQNEILYQNENLIRTENREPIVEWLVWERNVNKYRERYRAFSLTWTASMQIYGNKRKCLHKKRVQLLEDWFGNQHGRRFIVLEHQYGRRDVMWKRSIRRWNELVPEWKAAFRYHVN